MTTEQAIERALELRSFVEGTCNKIVHGYGEDAFMISLGKIPKQRTLREESFKSWFFLIAKRATLDEWRRRNYRQEISLDENPDIFPDQIWKKEMNVSLEDVMREASEDERDILELKYRGHTTKEISKILNLSITCINVRFYRLRNRIRSRFAL